jgi:hypothetical protein
LTVTVRLPESSTKEDIQIQFLPDNINIKLKDIQVLEGKLYSSIDHEGSTWTIKENDRYFCSFTLENLFLMTSHFPSDLSTSRYIEGEYNSFIYIDFSDRLKMVKLH